MKMKELVESVCKKVIPATQKYIVFELMVENRDSGEEVDLPYVRFQLQ
jgi:ubiquitin-activating enzyme E1